MDRRRQGDEGAEDKKRGGGEDEERGEMKADDTRAEGQKRRGCGREGKEEGREVGEREGGGGTWRGRAGGWRRTVPAVGERKEGGERKDERSERRQVGKMDHGQRRGDGDSSGGGGCRGWGRGWFSWSVELCLAMCVQCEQQSCDNAWWEETSAASARMLFLSCSDSSMSWDRHALN